MSVPAIIAIAFTTLAVPLWLKAAFAKPTPNFQRGTMSDMDPETAASAAPTETKLGVPIAIAVGEQGAQSNGGSTPPRAAKPWNPATSRWEIAMAEFDEQKESYYED